MQYAHALKTTQEKVKEKKRNLRLVKNAEKRLEKRKSLHKISNADQIRYLAVIALRTAKKPLSLYELECAFRDVLNFKLRSEYLLMELLMKQDKTGIIFVPPMSFGLAWERR